MAAPQNIRVLDTESKRKLDRVTALLCYVMTELSTKDVPQASALLNDNKDLAKWWDKHQQDDRDRLLRESALAKLSAKERKALGLENVQP